VYRCFVIPSGISSDKFLSQVEFEPENKAIVHHILLFQDQAQTCKILDDNDPLPGYSSSGGGIGSSTATLIGGWVPGGGILDIPQGMALRVKANSYFIMQIHYAPGSQSKIDSTKCHFKYSALPVPREVYIGPILNHLNGGNGGLTNGPLFIPANTVKTFNQQYTLANNFNASLISIAPHMHLVGKTYTVYSVNTSGDTTKLIHIPNWDFHWQGGYMFQKILKLPAGSILYGNATYDNTTNNILNPNSPPANVGLGEKTEDEMMLCYFCYTTYMPGDENIILDSSILNPSGIIQTVENSVSIYPNPVTHILRVTGLNRETPLWIYNAEGVEMKSLLTDQNITEINIDDLDAGLYFIRFGENKSKSFVIVK
jgi:hypothetical protein